MKTSTISNSIVIKYPSRALSKIPSKAIRQAIKDLIAAEKDNRYRINMAYWHRSDLGYAKCEVCLAGSVLRRIVNNPELDITPYVFKNKNLVNRLRGLDHFANGYAQMGLAYFSYSKTGIDTRYVIPAYETNPEAFKKQLLILADDLEAIGL